MGSFQDSKAWRQYRGAVANAKASSDPLNPLGIRYKTRTVVPNITPILIAFFAATFFFLVSASTVVWWAYAEDAKEYQQCLEREHKEVEKLQAVCIVFGTSCTHEAEQAVCSPEYRKDQ